MMSPGRCLLLLVLSAMTVNAYIDNAWFTYVDRVESARTRRDTDEEYVQEMPPECEFTSTPDPTPDPTAVHQNFTCGSLEAVDNHQYYHVKFEKGENYWKDMDSFGEPHVINQRLSDSSRHAVRVQLKFSYPFYGYNSSYLHVTSSGFLYVGQYSHRYLAATQYVAPLMADFNPSADTGSTISYFGNEEMFVAEWKELPLNYDNGVNFTFQALIHKNGTLIFSYKPKPMKIAEISDKDHPVKIGLADAYYHDTFLFPYISRRVIYEYHSVKVNFTKVDNASTIIFIPAETCTSRTSCSDCTTHQPKNFNCAWCAAINKCSDGFDRHRQNWMNFQCDVKNQTTCSSSPKPENVTVEPTTGMLSDSSKTSTTDNPIDLCSTLKCGPGHCTNGKCQCPPQYYGRECQSKKEVGVEANSQTGGGSSHAGVVVFVLFLFFIIVVMSSWGYYAYKNPTTPSGLYLIRITRCYYCKKSEGTSPSYKYQRTGAANI